MNSRYTSDPTLCGNAEQLKLLLRSFGPFTGRYHISYPPRKWEKNVISHMKDSCSDLDRKKIEVLIMKAKKDKSLITEEIKVPKGMNYWDYSLNWIDNLKKLHLHNTIFEGALLHAEDKSLNLATYTLEDLPFVSSEDVSVACKVSEFVRVSEFTLLQYPEIVFIDPYLDIGDKDRLPIIEEMLKLASTGNCESVKIFARAQEVNAARVSQTLKHIKSNLDKNIDISYFLIDDKKTEYAMHARYLFSLHGGIQVDRSFHVLKNKQKTHVSPIGKIVLDQLVRTYLENYSSFNIVRQF